MAKSCLKRSLFDDKNVVFWMVLGFRNSGCGGLGLSGPNLEGAPNQLYRTTVGQQKLARVTVPMGSQARAKGTKPNKSKEQNQMKPTNNQSSTQSINRPIARSINQSINQSNSQAFEPKANQTNWHTDI